MQAKAKKNVLFIITLFSVGGATETVVSLARGLQKRSYGVTIISGEHSSSEDNMEPIARAFGLKVKIVPWLKRDIHPWLDLKALIKLRNIIKEGKFDVVHTHSSKAGIIGRFAAHLAGVDQVVHTIHGLSFHRNQSSILRWSYVLLERLAARYTKRLVAVSYKIVEECLSAKVGERDKFIVIRSGFNTREFAGFKKDAPPLRALLGISAHDIILGNIGRLSPLKGHTLLLNCLPGLLKVYSRLRTIIIGDGEIKNELMRLVRRLKVNDSVHFLGSIPPTEIPRYLAAIDLLVHPSLHEGLPRVVPQAILMGKPVVMFDLDGAREIVADKVNGVLARPGDSSHLAERICEVIENYKTFARNCVGSKKTIANEFDEEKMVDQTVYLYEAFLKSNKR